MHARMATRKLASFIHFKDCPGHPVEKCGCLAVRFNVCAENDGLTIWLRHRDKPLHVGFHHAAHNCTNTIKDDKLCPF